MDVRVLNNFLAIAELQSLSRAAARLNLAQPALSRQIKLLEEELATRLFVRHRRGVSLTAAGQLLAERARAITAAVDDAKRAVSASSTEPAGLVSLGLANSLIHVISTDIVTRFVKAYPRAQLSVRERRGHLVERCLRDGQVDVAVMLSPGPMQDAHVTAMAEEPLCLAGAPEAGLRMDRPIAPQRLAALPLIALAGQSKVRATAEAAMQRRKTAIRPIVEVEGATLAFELMRQGLAYTLLPSCAVRAEIDSGRICGAPIQGLKLQWVLGVRRDRGEEPAVAALVHVIRELFADRIAKGVWKRPKAATARS